jgi:single-stranded-DNA-specific exonuclease
MPLARQALMDAVAVVPHTDADGLSAGAIALRARGEGADAAVLLGRGQTPFQADAPLPDGPLAILDWGIRPTARSGLLVDHHAPEADIVEGRLVGMGAPLAVTSYGEVPETPTGPMLRRIVPEAPAWLAAIGAVGDLGDPGLALPECHGAGVGRGSRSSIKKLVSLVNAPRRLPDGPVRTALALLVEHDDPRAALEDPRIAELEEAKAAWRAEFDRVVRTAPRMVGDRVALLRFASPAQVHPLVATTWSRRLAPRIVLAANDGYLADGVVNFAVRGGEGDLRRVLRDALPDVGGEFAHGHDRATGGSLEAADFERLLTALAA